jgi:signal transduction histidine kinase
MKRLFNAGATAQIASIVVVALLVAHALSAIVWLSFDKERLGPPPEFIRPAAQIGLVLHLLDTVPPPDHAAIKTAASQAGFTFTENAGAPIQVEKERFPAQGVRHALRAELGLASKDVVILNEDSQGQLGRGMDIFVHSLGAEESWIHFQFRHAGELCRPRPFFWLSGNGVASLVLIPILIGLISFWATRRVTIPLVKLAVATEGVSIVRDPSPVAEEGAREVRQVARAFNSVLERLQCIVADRTQMLASVGHDLRTPLTRLRLHAEATPNFETQRKMLNEIRRMEAMIDATLAFLREEAAHEPVEQVDVAVLIQTICDEFVDTGTEVDYDGPLHARATCRPLALQRALVNLVDNAAKFDTRITARLECNAEGLIISIEDDGPGISDEQKKAVFKPFFRGDASRSYSGGGMGLGLSIVEGVVQSHNGRIHLIDRLPNGLCVQLLLPQTPGRPGRQTSFS